MATPKRKRKKNGDSGNGTGDNQPPDDEEQVGPGNPGGDEVVRIHQAFIEHHLGGGAPATPEAYERAIEQWNELPGALRVPHTRPPRDNATPSPTKADGATSVPTEDEEGRENGDESGPM
jgi:hypothetical protein